MIHFESYAFLCSLRLARQEIQLCVEHIQRLDEATRRITSAWKDEPGRGGGDVRRDSALVALADRRAELLRKEMDYARQLLEVQAFIAQIQEPEYRIILTLRYVKLLRWPQVTEAMKEYGLYFSEGHVYRLHTKALLAAQTLWAQQHKEERT